MIGVQKVISVSFPGTVSFDTMVFPLFDTMVFPLFDTMAFPLFDTMAEEAVEVEDGERTSFSDASFGRIVNWTLCFGFGTDC